MHAGDHALQAAGLGDFETEGADTAIGGSRADQWASNQKGKLDLLHAALQRYPTIDIVHLYIGGNDFLRFAVANNLATLTPAQRSAQWKAICKDIQTLVDDILAQRPDLRVVLVDYDYLEPARMAKAYPTFPNAFFGVSTKVFNEALLELGREKQALAERTPRCYYVKNWGLLQHRRGLAMDLPDGDPALGSGDAMPDGVHPTPDGFEAIFAHVVRQYYAAWLKAK